MSLVEKRSPEKHGHHDVEFSGTLDEVLEAVKHEFVCYDPRGYGTSLQKMWYRGPDFVAALSRMTSCD